MEPLFTYGDFSFNFSAPGEPRDSREYSFEMLFGPGTKENYDLEDE